MHLPRIALACLVAACACALHAQEDPLKSQACGDALAALQAARAEKAPTGRIESLRGSAEQACLGSASLPTRPARTVQAPVHVPPPQIDVPVATPSLPAPVAPPPPVPIERYPQPATCDANGCWTNDGTHLRMVPANPPGLCTNQGGRVYCP